MTKKHFNELTPAQHERLSIFIEECGEAVQAAGKILRHGYDSHHPFTGAGNKDSFEREIGDIAFAIFLLQKGGDIDEQNVEMYAEGKSKRIRQYLHHQDGVDF